MEEKIYARTVNKTGLAQSVIDRKIVENNFTSKQLADLQSNLLWVQCDCCKKWRVLLDGESQEDLPEEWFCKDNSDPQHNSCEDPERDEAYYQRQDESADGLAEGQGLETLPSDESEMMSAKLKQGLLENDQILKHLLRIQQNGKKTKMVEKHVFHDLLVAPKDDPGISSAKKKNDASPSPTKPQARTTPQMSKGKKRAAGIATSSTTEKEQEAKNKKGASPSPAKPQAWTTPQMSMSKERAAGIVTSSTTEKEQEASDEALVEAEATTPSSGCGTMMNDVASENRKELKRRATGCQLDEDISIAESKSTSRSRRSSRARQEPKRFTPGTEVNDKSTRELPRKETHSVDQSIKTGNKEEMDAGREETTEARNRLSRETFKSSFATTEDANNRPQSNRNDPVTKSGTLSDSLPPIPGSTNETAHRSQARGICSSSPRRHEGEVEISLSNRGKENNYGAKASSKAGMPFPKAASSNGVSDGLDGKHEQASSLTDAHAGKDAIPSPAVTNVCSTDDGMSSKRARRGKRKTVASKSVLNEQRHSIGKSVKGGERDGMDSLGTQKYKKARADAPEVINLCDD